MKKRMFNEQEMKLSNFRITSREESIQKERRHRMKGINGEDYYLEVTVTSSSRWEVLRNCGEVSAWNCGYLYGTVEELR